VDDLIGQRVFGGYVVSRRIGEGGMGGVYLVENPEIGRRLALKVLQQQWSSDREMARRFLAEARAASAISHPNIIEVLDASCLPDGRTYILMELVDGETLADHVSRCGALSVEAALSVMTQTCAALDAAHTRGIIHRDLKPQNIMIAPRPGNPLFVKVLDFGIAKLTDPAMAGGMSMTRTNAVAGTPAYMSPEQARGLRDVDRRTDVYALGVTAYQILTGRLPYRAESLGELVFQQMSSAPPSPSEIRRDLPSGWGEAIRDAMATDPALRPATAGELAARLTAASSQVRAGRIATVPRVTKRRRPWLLPTLFGMTIALLVVGVGLVIGRRPAPAPVTAPVVPDAAPAPVVALPDAAPPPPPPPPDAQPPAPDARRRERRPRPMPQTFDPDRPIGD
jgi:eukaryotic-like serine/threonine-protein kinase